MKTKKNGEEKPKSIYVLTKATTLSRSTTGKNIGIKTKNESF